VVFIVVDFRLSIFALLLVLPGFWPSKEAGFLVETVF
jgi:hypothetical protein